MMDWSIMSTLGEVALAALFAAVDTFTIGLSNEGKTVAVSGYEPAVTRTDEWIVDGPTAEVTVTFGPYAEPYDVDAVVVASGTMVEVQPLEHRMRVWPGVMLNHIVTLGIDG